MKQPYSTLEESIESGREMLSWKDNWDDEGSIKYSPELFERLVEWCNDLHRYGNRPPSYKDMPIPHIMPGPDGTFDIQWASEHGANLAVNYSDLGCSYAIKNNTGFSQARHIKPEHRDSGIVWIVYLWHFANGELNDTK